MTRRKRTSRYGFGRNAYKEPGDRVVGWGKYKGKKMRDVPTEYLRWFVSNAYPQMAARKEYAQQELDRRKESNETARLSGKIS